MRAPKGGLLTGVLMPWHIMSRVSSLKFPVRLSGASTSTALSARIDCCVIGVCNTRFLYIC
jgi:hypothetical protein